MGHDQRFPPNHLRVERAKVAGYLLNRDHTDGRSKAIFFERFGFKTEEWETLAQALRAHGRTQPVVSLVETSRGARYIVEGEVASPDGRNPWIRTVWIVEGEPSEARLITAYPHLEPR